jgi:formamidopyrimidine-DNA glycosylase
VPELPEVETIRRGLLPLLTGRKVVGVTVRERRLRQPIGRSALGRLRGATLTGVRRRSKYLLLETDAGWTVLLHLGMTGQVWVSDAARERRRHEHVVIRLDDGRELRYADARRFGLIDLIADERLAEDTRLKGLGLEPLENGLTGAWLYQVTRGRRKPVKNFLMDTRMIAGVGNIYACEALYRAGVNPRRPVRRIGREAWGKVAATIRAVLTEAIEAGGTTMRDFLNAEGDVGYFAVKLRVYDRKGEACGRCGAAIRRIVQAGRSTFYCPRCQK